jgi:predicted transcriptional regulator
MATGDELEEMVERVEWMSPVDYSILEFYDNHDIVIAPSSLSSNIDYGSSYTADRCLILSKAGLLGKHHGPKYELTDKGRKFLAGEIDADELEEPE